MSDSFIRSCKNRLANIISMEAVTESDDSFAAFSAALLNMHSHYCLDDHTSKWCTHEKVHSIKIQSSYYITQKKVFSY